MLHRKSILLTVVLLTLVACGGNSGDASTPAAQASPYVYAVPPVTGDGWTTGHLTDNGIDVQKITDMVQGVHSGRYAGIDSIVIVRNSTLLLAELFRSELDQYDGWIRNQMLSRHIMHSTSKSVTSALIGIAIDQGYITSIEVPFYSLFNYPSYQNWDDRKLNMTLQDALTMRLGLTWDEWSAPYGDPQNDLQILTTNSSDHTKALLDMTMDGDPGSTYAYNTAATIAIGQALENATGVSMEAFADTYLFQPMQIITAEWGRTPTGLPNGGSGLFLETRDMAKFGQLFITGGVWAGQQLVSASWTSESTARHVQLRWNYTSGYGYQWWRDSFTKNGIELDSWSTRGFGGQFIFCIPSLGLVVAFTGKNYENSLAQLPFDLMQDYIIPGVSP